MAPTPSTPSEFACYLVRKQEDGSAVGAVETLNVTDLPAGDVLIRVAYSSVNYKDALACHGHPGVVTSFPHVPGIDCAGTVVDSTSPTYVPGESVLVTGYDLGSSAWGGFSGCVRVPAEWVVPLPDGLTVRDAMILGTAGFTAAQAISAITGRGIDPADGEVAVTGASGGVGSIAVAILAKLGYRVAAVTGKPGCHDLLRSLGASRLLDRNEVIDETGKPLLEARWAAAVDTVGGQPLATIIRSTKHRGVVAACGLVAGVELSLTVYPFILRGVTLAGIDSAKCPREPRLQIWQRLAREWQVPQLDRLAVEIDLRNVNETVHKMLAGESIGRVLVRPVAENGA